MVLVLGIKTINRRVTQPWFCSIFVILMSETPFRNKQHFHKLLYPNSLLEPELSLPQISIQLRPACHRAACISSPLPALRAAVQRQGGWGWSFNVFSTHLIICGQVVAVYFALVQRHERDCRTVHEMLVVARAACVACNDRYSLPSCHFHNRSHVRTRSRIPQAHFVVLPAHSRHHLRCHRFVGPLHEIVEAAKCQEASH
jgi:hypothetical protein